MSNNNLEKDWRKVVESPSKIKFETKRSYQYAHRSRLTIATNYEAIYPGTRRERVASNILIVIDLKSKFNKEAIDEFLSQALDYYQDNIGLFLKVKVSLFDGEKLTDFIDLSEYKSLNYVEVTNDSNYKTIIDVSRREKIEEVIIFTDGNDNNVVLNVKDISLKYCFDNEEDYEKADKISKYDKGCIVKK